MSSNTQKAVDLTELLAGNVEAVTAQLASLDDYQLRRAEELEGSAEKPRSTLMAAITGLREARADEAEQARASELAAARQEGAKDAEMLRTQNEALTRKVADLEAKLSKSSAVATPKATKAKVAKPTPLSLDNAASADKPVAVIFADRNDNWIPQLTPLEFGEGGFGALGRDSTLDTAIEFDGTEPAVEVASVWQVDALGKPVAVSRLMQPILIGGGRRGSLPESSLRFTAPAPDSSSQAASAALTVAGAAVDAAQAVTGQQAN